MRSDAVSTWRGKAVRCLDALARLVPHGRERLWRPALLLAILAVHVVLLLWLALLFAVGPPVRRADRGLVSITLKESSGATPQPRARRSPVRTPTTLPVEAAALPIPAAVDPPTASVGEGGPGAGTASGGCALALDVGWAIARDPAAIAELDALPAEARSSADAVMLWNGGWLNANLGPAATGGALRRAVQTVVVSAAPDCRDRPMTGPQFIPVPDAGRTVMVVIGSGAWRWSDLLPPTDQSSAGAADRAVPKPIPSRQNLFSRP